MEDSRLGKVVKLCQMYQHSGHHTACPAGRGSSHRAARGVLLAHGQGISEDAAAALERRFVRQRLRIVRRCLAGEVQWPGQCALMVDATVYRALHYPPHFAQIVPDILVLALLHILPIAASIALAPAENVLDGVEFVALFMAEAMVLLAFSLRQCAPADAVHRPLFGGMVVSIE